MFKYTWINPLYTNGFFLLVWFHKLGTVHCACLGASGYNFKKILFSSEYLFYLYKQSRPYMLHFICVFPVCKSTRLGVFTTALIRQRLWSNCMYVQADLSPCWSHIAQCWKSHVKAQLWYLRSTSPVVSENVWKCWPKTDDLVIGWLRCAKNSNHLKVSIYLFTNLL